MHDVAIVGASIAGAATATHLARRGHSVVMLDRVIFPRRKACGEGLFPAGVRELDALGILPGLEGRCSQLTGLRFRAGVHVAEASLSGLGVSRQVLDAALLSVAQSHGVDVRTGVRVHDLLLCDRRVRALATSHGEVSARAFVAADGLHSPLRRQAKLDGGRAGRRYGISAHVALGAPIDPLVDVTFATDHELYITPIGESTANVALLLRRHQVKRFAGRLAGGYREVLAHSPILQGACPIDEPKLAGPFPRTAHRAWRANLLLVGDAAGFFDGISGEGMTAALLGARSAAVAIAEYIETGSYDPFRAYEQDRRAIVRDSNLLARLSLLLGSREVTAQFAVRNLARNPGTFAKLVAINAGEAPITSLRPRDAVALVAGV